MIDQLSKTSGHIYIIFNKKLLKEKIKKNLISFYLLIASLINRTMTAHQFFHHTSKNSKKINVIGSIRYLNNINSLDFLYYTNIF